MLSSNPEGLAQFENMVRRDRNHPSVFLWSMGNEESISVTDTGLRILTSMKRIAVKHDGSRPITIAPPPMGDYMGRGGLAVCDVMGYNYADPQAEAYHKANPKVAVIGTENVSAVGTRGIYVTDRAKGYRQFATTHTQPRVARRRKAGGGSSAHGPGVAGGFVWTGFDYRGEPSPYQWPNISSQYGVIDTCGFPKDTFFYYQSWWTSKPVLHVFPHWNWPGLEGQEIVVWVHSNMDRVELFHNGRSLGAKDLPKDQHLAWNVTYAPGTIEARGYKGGQQVMTAKRETTGAPAKLVLRLDRQEIAADGEDVAICAVEVQDAQGRVVPITSNEVTLQRERAGERDRNRQRRPDEPAVRHRLDAQGVLGIVHGNRSVHGIGREHQSGGHFAWIGGRDRDHHHQGCNAPASGCSVGAHSSVRHGHHGTVEADGRDRCPGD